MRKRKRDEKPVGEGEDDYKVAVGGIQDNHLKDPLDSKPLPTFDLYIIEEKEGSGGFGTVYRARRKSDGRKFAIKYPHPNANKYYVDNERKMLERFGGKAFVIKYEGSCRSENTDCIVLKHVEHDRPSVLMKKIVIFEIQWYAYCMFAALARLHKLGVVHRDVKPGNILFSRKTCIGYLSDFNLAKVLHQKQPNTGKSVKQRKNVDVKAHRCGGFGSCMESKMLRKKSLSAKDIIRSSRERLREPLPCQGRKELVNLAREAMQTAKQQVAAFQVRDRTTTSLKLQKEGPCGGTEGFRAPEVLLRSTHQGPKLDIWSAGVTLVYLFIGKLPFAGKPQQNIKDIVKLRGSEQLLELAKLHDCESSVPVDLRDDHHPMELREWCEANTKRPDFLDAIPGSLLDLVNKCLAVNPRCRISAEEALKHEFFAPCVDAIRKARLLRQKKRNP